MTKILVIVIAVILGGLWAGLKIWDFVEKPVVGERR